MIGKIIKSFLEARKNCQLKVKEKEDSCNDKDSFICSNCKCKNKIPLEKPLEKPYKSITSQKSIFSTIQKFITARYCPNCDSTLDIEVQQYTECKKCSSKVCQNCNKFGFAYYFFILYNFVILFYLLDVPSYLYELKNFVLYSKIETLGLIIIIVIVLFIIFWFLLKSKRQEFKEIIAICILAAVIFRIVMVVYAESAYSFHQPKESNSFAWELIEALVAIVFEEE